MTYRINSFNEFNEIQEKLRQAYNAKQHKILVCASNGCVASGSIFVYEAFLSHFEKRGLNVEVVMKQEPEEGLIQMRKTGCQGFCELGPLIRIEPEGWLYTKVKPSDVDEIIDKTILNGEFIERLGYNKNGESFKKAEDIPFFKKQTRRVLKNCGDIDAENIDEYIAVGGYRGLAKAIFEMSNEEVIQEITDSNIRGRGGAGFTTGKKWSQVAAHNESPKYIVCNGDEGDPGAFMDCSCMEGNPNKVIEGMAIASVATNSQEGVIYVRAEYPLAVKRLQNAITQAEERGILGDHMLGSDKNFHLRISMGAGAFVCGEGSAMTASIEGNRGMPRVKPPRTVDKGLFEKPTCLNNVETFANIPDIIVNGANWFKELGNEKSTGTKAFALSGNVNNTGLIEVPMGTTMREIIFDIGGGIKNGKKFKAVQIGGPSGGCLKEEHLDLPVDFDSLSSVGAIIGSGGIVVMDEDTCMVSIAQFFMNFTCEESCGKCTPCREGTTRMLEILNRITNGKGKDGDIEELKELATMIKTSSLCGLGKSAPNPVLSTLQHFEDEYREHIYDKVCKTKTCQGLLNYYINPDECIGCTLCARNCPAGAIVGELKQTHKIDSSICVKCGSCITNCPKGAIGVK